MYIYADPPVFAQSNAPTVAAGKNSLAEASATRLEINSSISWQSDRIPQLMNTKAQNLHISLPLTFFPLVHIQTHENNAIDRIDVRKKSLSTKLNPTGAPRANKIHTEIDRTQVHT